MGKTFGAEFRRVENREFEGKAALVVVAVRTYDTTVDDLWNAVTTPDRIRRFFAAVEGDLRLGGRYKLKGNAEGTITRCDPPEALDLTWEFAGATSWVTLRLTAEGKKARLTLEHIAHKDGIGKEHLEKYGPGAVGIGWDLGFEALGKHLAAPSAEVDHAAFEAWSRSSEGKDAMRGSGKAWADADVQGGEDSAEAHARADRTIAFYTGG